MVNTYVLVNPYIQGSFEKQIKAKNSIEAGRSLYNSLSEHFNNNVPKFLFTIQKGTSGKGKYYSFKVKEKKEDNEINFSIEPLTIKNEEIAYKNFQNRLSEFKEKNQEDQEGGAKKKKSSKKASKKSSKKSKKGSKKPKGGKKKNTKKSDSDEDLFKDIDIDELEDDSDDVNNKKMIQRYVPTNSYPIYNYWYDPFVYRLNSIYIPTFYSYITPYIQIELHP